MKKIVCVTGLCGAGKSIVSDSFTKAGFQYLRFGQITLDEVKKRGLEVNEANERLVREEIRKEHGMAAFAILNLKKLEELLESGDVIADGLYSFAEYKVLKDHFGEKMRVIAVWAPPKLRYERISKRTLKDGDKDVRYRPLTVEEAKSRDIVEIEKLEKGGTIAMADYTILNHKDVNYLEKQIEEILNEIKHD